MSGFSLYVHIPYCQAKCPYCDFNSHVVPNLPEAAYVAALCAELEGYAQRPPWIGGEVRTVFFGGGTPSLFAPASIGRILHEIGERWTLAADVETTLEANPGTVSLEQLRRFRTAGINRVSFGVQSFAAHHLRTLGRIHSGADAITAVRWAQEAGFSSVSIDLIFGLPNQTLLEWESDLAQACALRPNHVSAYNLTYEEGTPFHLWRAQGKLRQLEEESEAAMFSRTEIILRDAGYQHYEISNYAQPGHSCRHNLNYWHSGPYLGVGAGAHSYAPAGAAFAVPWPEDDADAEVRIPLPAWGWRWSNERNPSRYMRAVETRGHARSGREALDEHQARGEFVFLGLRCQQGFAAAAFRQRFGADLPAIFPHVRELRDGGLLQCTAGQWQLTPRGLLVADSVFATFL